jgi:hypothetical protein
VQRRKYGAYSAAADGNANRFADTDEYTDAFAAADGDTDAYRDTDGDAGAYCDTDSDTDAYCDTDSGAVTRQRRLAQFHERRNYLRNQRHELVRSNVRCLPSELFRYSQRVEQQNDRSNGRAGRRHRSERNLHRYADCRGHGDRNRDRCDGTKRRCDGDRQQDRDHHFNP